MTESKYGKYVVTELKIPEEKQRIAADYAKYATRILWMDDNVVEGAFHMNTAWYLKAAGTLEDKAVIGLSATDGLVLERLVSLGDNRDGELVRGRAIDGKASVVIC